MAKILRGPSENNKAQFPNISAVLSKKRYYVFISFNMLKMEFKFEYTILITKV